MNFKRLEIYVWWTCNQKCTYCIEFSNMEQAWDKKVTKYEILKKLLKYKKLWYNHVTYLWWEPFIQPVFYDALKLWKKLWYTILVTTNCTTLHLDSQASKFLPYIDELFLSVEAISKEDQQVISRTKNYVHWNKVFENIDKYWKWSFLKANIVLTQDNKDKLFDLVKFLYNKWVSSIAITYPDVTNTYYEKKHILERINPTYTESMKYIVPIVDYCKQKNIHLKIADIPFCVFPRENILEYIKITDDYDYWSRIKINYEWKILNRWKLDKKDYMPRQRFRINKCTKCIYRWKCWWPLIHYEWLYWLDEINPIENE